MTSYVILAIHPAKPVTPVTKRDNRLAAKSVVNELNMLDNRHSDDYKGAIYRFVEQGTVYCNQCGKSDNWDSPQVCKKPIGCSDEWACEMGLNGLSRGVTA
tara:strand:+ start:510 stop:812 length:303 start_codon:yes stop_codon:yes gene_type:complete